MDKLNEEPRYVLTFWFDFAADAGEIELGNGQKERVFEKQLGVEVTTFQSSKKATEYRDKIWRDGFEITDPRGAKDRARVIHTRLVDFEQYKKYEEINARTGKPGTTNDTINPSNGELGGSNNTGDGSNSGIESSTTGTEETLLSN
jgi:hypothetical protein